MKFAIDESPAPPPIIIALPSPAAVPANLGLIDIMAAVAFGSDIPLPKPTSSMNPKKENMDPIPNKLMKTEIETPRRAIFTPRKIILSEPTLEENLPEIKLPTRYPIAGVPKKSPKSFGSRPKTSLPTNGAPPR